MATERPQKWIALVIIFKHLIDNIPGFSDRYVPPMANVGVMPVKSLEPGEMLDSIRDDVWAEINIPYHPTDEELPIYGFTLYIVGKPNHEPAVVELMMADANKEDLYQLFKDQCEPMEDAFKF